MYGEQWGLYMKKFRPKSQFQYLFVAEYYIKGQLNNSEAAPEPRRSLQPSSLRGAYLTQFQTSTQHISFLTYGGTTAGMSTRGKILIWSNPLLALNFYFVFHSIAGNVHQILEFEWTFIEKGTLIR